MSLLKFGTSECHRCEADQEGSSSRNRVTLENFGEGNAQRIEAALCSDCWDTVLAFI